MRLKTQSTWHSIYKQWLYKCSIESDIDKWWQFNTEQEKKPGVQQGKRLVFRNEWVENTDLYKPILKKNNDYANVKYNLVAHLSFSCYL